MKENCRSSQGLDVNVYLSALKFVSSIFFSQHPLTLFPLTSILYYVHQTKHKRCVVSSVPDYVFHKLASSAGYQKESDIDTCVLVNRSTLEKLCSPELSVSGFKSSWLKFSKYSINSMGRRSVKSCIVKSFGVNDVEGTCMIVCETAYFNIKQKLGFDFDVNQLKVWAEHSTAHFDSDPSKHFQFKPHIAVKASIGLIQSPFDIDLGIIDSLLKSYFTTPRYLCLGDLFSINIFRYCPQFHYSALIPTPTIFFKLLEVEGLAYKFPYLTCGYLIKKDITMLLQCANQQGYMPPSLTCCTSNFDFVPKYFGSYLLSNCPAGLDDIYNELMISFRPFLHCDQIKIRDLRPVFLLCGPTGVGKRKVIDSVAKAIGLHVWILDCLELKGSTPGYTEGKLKFIFKKVMLLQPCIVVLRNIDSLCLDNDGNEDARVIGAIHDQILMLFKEKQNRKFPILLVGTCNSKSRNLSCITPGLARAFLHVMHMDTPSESNRAAMLNWILKRSNLMLDGNVLLNQLAARSSGFLYEDLKALVAHAIRIHYSNLKHLTSEDLKNVKKNCLLQKDFEDALDVMHGTYSDAIGAPKIPAVSWSDIGGLAPLKEEITRTITMPLQHPALVASGLKRSGILLFGPPGTGKTMLAKAVATECNLNFLSVKGPELLNMYVGQSEENVREVFERARAAAPCIIFFDELDSLAPNRGKSGDSAGVMDRVVSQLLAEMDGMQKSTHLYVIGATNRPDLIDPALLRPGRFDKLLYVGVCEDQSAQLSVMSAITRKFDLSDDVILQDIVSLLPHNLTGADLFSVCSNAWRNAAKRIIQGFKNGGIDRSNTPDTVVVNGEDFKAAVLELSPSVSAKDLQYFHHLHQRLVTK